jgi:hypothetical protein
MVTVPFALIGGFWLMWILRYNMSIATAVGFIALSGVAAEFGVVMLLYLKQALKKKEALGQPMTVAAVKDAVMEGAVLRVRPKAMTVAVILAVGTQGGLSPAELASWIFGVFFVNGLITILFSWLYRQPLAFFWTIPGTVLVGQSLTHLSFPQIVGTFYATGLLMFVLGSTGSVKRVMELVPLPIVMGMVAGVFLRFGLDLGLLVLEGHQAIGRERHHLPGHQEEDSGPGDDDEHHAGRQEPVEDSQFHAGLATGVEEMKGARQNATKKDFNFEQ